MSTDLAQEKSLFTAKRTSYSSKLPLELTRDEGFLNGDHDIFDILARGRSPNFQPGPKEFNATLGLLERAKKMLRSADAALQAKSQRIAELESESEYCTVTGLLNERGFKIALKKEIARTNRGLNEGGLLVIFNLENYNHINQHHGQSVAGEALRLVARALMSETRTMDYAARVNENEFVILFAETNMEVALGRLQNMALQLNRLNLKDQADKDIHLSLSLGLKSFSPGARAEQIFQCANDDLQRNRRGTPTHHTA